MEGTQERRQSEPAGRQVNLREVKASNRVGEAAQAALMVKNLPANAGNRDLGSIPGLGRSPGGGHGDPLQCSCLVGNNPQGRQSRTQLRGQHTAQRNAESDRERA